jgi:glycosyltransferase involved in cell wall biosynthesis
MQKIKVLHIVTALSWRGGEQQVAYLLDELDCKVNQFVLCSEGSLMEAHCMEQEIEHFTHAKRSGFDLSYAKKIRNLCQEFKIDVCHMHDAHAHTFAILAADIYGNKLPLVLSRRVDFPIKKKWSSKHKYNHKLIKKILCVSNAIKDITAEGINDKSKLLTVYSGIDLTKFGDPKGSFKRELNIRNEEILIGNTSALADHKDYFTFLDVAENIVRINSNVKFVILGDGPMREEIINYGESKNLGEKLIFTGFRSDIPQILADLNLFLITSKTEGLGTSILDAFACKVPVIATAAGGIPELVIDRHTGLLNPIKDVDSIAKGILELINNPELASILVNNAFSKVQMFSKKETAKQTLSVYETIVF